MKVRSHNILLTEHEGKVAHVVGTPLVQSAFFFDTLHVLMRSRHDDADCLYLVVTDFACQPCVFQTVLDGCCSVFHSIGIVDEFSVKMRASWIGVLRYDKTLDVGGRSAVGTVRLFHM